MLGYLLTIVSTSYGSLPNARTIYITSDDGPLPGTKNLINVMLKTKTPITLFMVGLHYDNAKQDVRNFISTARKSPLIDVGNHSYTHAHNHYRYFYHHCSDVIQDLKKNNTTLGLKGDHIITRLPGRDVFRTPNLKKDDPYITKAEDTVETIDDDAIYKNGFYIFGWDLEWAHNIHGKPIQSVTHLVQEIEDKFNAGNTILPNKLILLMHDEMFQEQFNGPEQLQQLITKLHKKGYKFDLIKNYLRN
ncbi:polysaccharide deacetylase family protein [Rickettsia bellii]|uniref:polysaccharide deacetylase family protein n=1 Tax=Rickettsia bellii TaxID=33990 RepID=UPI0005A2FF6F